jgi:uncharacterized protein YijF (DUF1287 family)
MAFLAQTTASFCKKFIITLVFDRNANFFRRKLAKFAENCDHNIDHRRDSNLEPLIARQLC